MSVSAFPGAVREVAMQARKTRVHVAELGECGNGAADARVQIRMRPPPVGSEETIDTIVRHQQRTYLDVPQRTPELFDRGQYVPIDCRNRRKIILDQPEARGLGVPGDDHNPMLGDTRQLCEATHAVSPV